MTVFVFCVVSESEAIIPQKGFCLLLVPFAFQTISPKGF